MIISVLKISDFARNAVINPLKIFILPTNLHPRPAMWFVTNVIIFQNYAKSLKRGESVYPSRPILRRVIFY